MQALTLKMRLTLAFGLLLLILVVVAAIGYRGQLQVADRVDKLEGVEHISSSILEARGQEREYLLHADEEDVRSLNTALRDLKTAARDLRGEFSDAYNIEQMDDVLRRTEAYEAAFAGMVEAREAEQTVMVALAEAGAVVLEQMRAIQFDQQRQLDEQLAANNEVQAQKMAFVDASNQLVTDVLAAKALRVQLVANPDDQALRTEWLAVNKELMADARELQSRFQFQRNIDQLDRFLEAYGEYERIALAFFKGDESVSVEQIGTTAGEALAAVEELLADQRQQFADNQVEAAAFADDKVTKMRSAGDLLERANTIRRTALNYQVTEEERLYNQARTELQALMTAAEALRDTFRLQVNIDQINEAIEGVRAYQRRLDAYHDAVNRQNDAVATMEAAAMQALAVVEEARADQSAKLSSEMAASKAFQTVVAVIGILVGVAAAFFIVITVNRAVRTIIRGLTESSDQVASAAGEVSQSSQQLASGASEQAASVEETSSSLEELSSMTRQNAEAATAASQLMAQTEQVVTTANASLQELTASMDAISSSSEETKKIVKTIDEIAFQTNILALNAAVEAARAGEAGAGFAVVADEVRSLAGRAAEAARNTADLIEGSSQKIRSGTGIVTETNKAFGEVATTSREAGERVREIATASEEQARGIDQINNAMADLDKVVQQNASNSEESAAAAEEMNAQSETMRDYVRDLTALIDGGGGSGNGARAASGNVGGSTARPRLITPKQENGHDNHHRSADFKPHKNRAEGFLPAWEGEEEEKPSSRG